MLIIILLTPTGLANSVQENPLNEFLCDKTFPRFEIDYGPPSMLLIPDVMSPFSSTMMPPVMQKEQILNGLKSNLDKNDTLHKNECEARVLETKSTEISIEKRLCYRCALTTKDVKDYYRTFSSDEVATKTMKKSKSEMLFSNPNFTPTEEQRNQLEELAQDRKSPSKSPCLSSAAAASCKLSRANKENLNSSYKEIFQEIFHILHKAQNSAE